MQKDNTQQFFASSILQNDLNLRGHLRSILNLIDQINEDKEIVRMISTYDL